MWKGIFRQIVSQTDRRGQIDRDGGIETDTVIGMDRKRQADTAQAQTHRPRTLSCLHDRADESSVSLSLKKTESTLTVMT